ICDFIIINLDKVSRNNVKVKEIAVKDIIKNELNFKEISFTVSSLRIDSIISGVYNLSRTESVKLIKGEKVNIDYEKILSPSKEVKSQSLVSVRGHGRFIVEIGDLTKKGRIKIKGKIFL
ncbi:MAG: RNA-binding protein, partial [Intestinibacter sp.]|nr:RNA-binding protein [Intestinibacter sp.]